MPLADGEFHSDALAEGRAAIGRRNRCVSAAVYKLLEAWEAMLRDKKAPGANFLYRVTVDECELFSQGFCVLTCNEGIAVAVGSKGGRCVVLAISTFDDLSWEGVNEEAELDVARRAVGRIKDI